MCISHRCTINIRRSERISPVFRELLQNSDDAGAKAVEIHFETKSYLDRRGLESGLSASSVSLEEIPDLKTTLVRSCNILLVAESHARAQVHQWSFKNNGMIFREEDWNRLKKIGSFIILLYP